MQNLEIITGSMHDGVLMGLSIDWLGRTVVAIGTLAPDDVGRCTRFQLSVGGVFFCVVEAPECAPSRGYVPDPEGGLWIGAGVGFANEDTRLKLPELPEGTALIWIFVQQWNSFIHICGRSFELS